MPAGFAPITWDGGMLPFQDDIWEVIQAMLFDQDMHTAHGNGDGIIVKGCVATLNGAGPNIDITAGIIYLTKTDEFLRVAAQTNVVDTQYGIINTVVIQETFKDSVLRDFVENKTAAVSASVPGDNNYVRWDVATPGDTSKTLKEAMAHILDPLEDWITVSSEFDSKYEVVSASPLRYRKDSNGLVSIEGGFQSASGQGNPAHNDIVLTMPAGYRPTVNRYFQVQTVQSITDPLIVLIAGTTGVFTLKEHTTGQGSANPVLEEQDIIVGGMIYYTD